MNRWRTYSPRPTSFRVRPGALLKQLLGAKDVTTDPDGDYPVRYQSALYYVRLDPGSHDAPVVQIFAVALADVPSSPALLEELNLINSRLRFARIFWVREQVLVESELVGEELSLAGLGTACDTVGGAADYFGPRLAEKFGGTTAFSDEQDSDYAPPSDPSPPGLYL